MVVFGYSDDTFYRQDITRKYLISFRVNTIGGYGENVRETKSQSMQG
jgi:hypothetical protein